jgi:hypothetical protein
MRSRIVSEKDLATAINMLMAGNIPASTSDVVNLVQRLQATEVYSEKEAENPKEAKMEVVRDDV